MLLGYDIGSSSIKAALVNSATGTTVGVVHSPETEMDIFAGNGHFRRTARLGRTRP